MCRQPDPAPVESAANHGKYYWKAQAQAKDAEIASLKAELAEANGTLQEHESEKWCFNDQHVMKSDLATAQIAAIELAKKLAEVKCASGEELARVTAERDELQKAIESLQEALAAYAGWSPHQFTGLLAEHRRLQESYRDLDARRFAAEADARRLREALDASRCFKDHTLSEAYKCKRCVARAALAPPAPAPTSRSVCFQCGEDITGTDHRGKCSADPG